MGRDDNKVDFFWISLLSHVEWNEFRIKIIVLGVSMIFLLKFGYCCLPWVWVIVSLQLP